jgi:hypothetical protein
VGDTAAAAIAARYLAGAGLGHLWLIGRAAPTLARELGELNPDVELTACGDAAEWSEPPARQGAPTSAQVLAVDVAFDRIEAWRTRHRERRAVLLRTTARGACLLAVDANGGCAACAFGAHIVVGEPDTTIASVSAGVAGALAALDLLKHALGREALRGGATLLFDVATGVLESRELPSQATCPRCARR